MTDQVAPTNRPLFRSIRAASSISLAALLLFGCALLQTAKAAGETRTISFYHTHTKENLTITYKVNGRYDPEALKKLDHFMRDWRENRPIRMDPELIDLLWEVHRETGAREPISVVCGYRSPETNSMLRRRSSGVAKASQHMLGKAIDFFIPGVSTDELRAAGLRAQRGGVGYYGSSFVHMDTGSVRHWPRMPDAQVAKILAKGQLASHNATDDRSTRRVSVAEAQVTSSGTPSSAPSFLSKLFGGGDDHETDAETGAANAAEPVQTASAAPKIARATMAARAPDKPAVAPEPRREKLGAIPMPQAKPVRAETYQVASAGSVPAKTAGFQVASATSTPVRLENVKVAQAPSPLPVRAESDASDKNAAPVRPAHAASLVGRENLSANDVINDRGYWQGLPSTDASDTSQSTVTRSTPATRRAAADKVATANVAPWPIADRGNDRAPSVGALGYAPQAAPTAARMPPATHNRVAAAANPESTLPPPVIERKGPDIVQVGDRFNDPWVRAMMVSPSAQRFMKTTLYGSQDFRSLGPLLAKPAAVLSSKFVDDPMNGMSTEKFGGSAVAFTPTINFLPRTASLR